MALIEIDASPIKIVVIFHGYVKSPIEIDASPIKNSDFPWLC